MEFLVKLTQLANKLDAKGLHAEADVIDNILKVAEGLDFSGDVGQEYEFSDGKLSPIGRGYEFMKIDPYPPGQGTEMDIEGYPKSHMRSLDRLRTMVGLKPGAGFDRALANKLKQLNKKYPVWVPGAKQKVSEIMANVEQAKAKEFEYAKQPTQPSRQVSEKPRPTAPSPTLPSGTRAPAPQRAELPPMTTGQETVEFDEQNPAKSMFE